MYPYLFLARGMDLVVYGKLRYNGGGGLAFGRRPFRAEYIIYLYPQGFTLGYRLPPLWGWNAAEVPYGFFIDLKHSPVWGRGR